MLSLCPFQSALLQLSSLFLPGQYCSQPEKSEQTLSQSWVDSAGGCLTAHQGRSTAHLGWRSWQSCARRLHLKSACSCDSLLKSSLLDVLAKPMLGNIAVHGRTCQLAATVCNLYLLTISPLVKCGCASCCVLGIDCSDCADSIWFAFANSR